MFGKKKATDAEEKKKKKVRPKKEKKQKEPKQKKEKKPKKEKKVKTPKKKPPKPPKKPKPKKQKKKMNPLILVILLLAALVIAAAGALVFLTKQREKEEDDMYGPMFYFTEEDGIESIRSKIGNREIKGGYKPPVDLTAEKESSEEAKEDEEDKSEEKEDEKKSSSENKSQDEEEDAEEEKDPELAEVDVKLLTDQVLAYITPGDGVQEAQEYMTYLVQEKGFKLLTYPEGSEGEIPKEAPTPAPTQEAEEDEDKKDKEDKKEKEEKEEAKDSEEENEEFIPPEEGYYIAALDNKDTAEEGAATEIKRVRMEYNYDSYTLRLSTANGVVNDLIPPEPEEEEESGPKGITLSNAVDTLQGMSAEQLQLPKAVTEYEMTPIQGRVVINGIDFFNVRAYEKGPEKTLFFGGAYYVSSDGESVYKHDEMTGDLTLISGMDILAEAQQQNISNNGNVTVQSGNN